MRFNRPLFTALVFGLTGMVGGCKDGPTGPTEPPLSAYSGTWTGTTSQNRQITLWVGSAGIIDSIRVQIRIDLISGLSSCLVTYVPTEVSISQSRTFTTMLESPSQITGSLEGNFESTTAAAGDFHIAWDGVVLCGSSVIFGSGGKTADGTWTASRS